MALKDSTIPKLSQQHEANAHARGAAGIRQIGVDVKNQLQEMYGWLEVTSDVCSFTCDSYGSYGAKELTYTNVVVGKAISGQFSNVVVTEGSLDGYIYPAVYLDLLSKVFYFDSTSITMDSTERTFDEQ